MFAPRLIDDGERFPIDMKKTLEDALHVIRNLATVKYGEAYQKLDFAYTYLGFWGHRFSGHKMSEKNTKPVYDALNRAWESFIASTPEERRPQHEFIEEAQKTMKCIIKIERANDDFTAKMKEVFGIKVNITYSQDSHIPQPMLEVFLEHCVKEVSLVETRMPLFK